MKKLSKATQKQIVSYGSEDAVVAAAIQILQSRIVDKGTVKNPDDLRDYLRLNLGNLEHEVFWVIYLNSQHGILAMEEASRGTLSQAPVYSREIVKAALRVNAAAVVFVHNHPSGMPIPSASDIALTEVLVKALALIEVKVLDHMIVAQDSIMSFAENGLM
jgi:DNA repair protein RadC